MILIVQFTLILIFTLMFFTSKLFHLWWRGRFALQHEENPLINPLIPLPKYKSPLFDFWFNFWCTIFHHFHGVFVCWCITQTISYHNENQKYEQEKECTYTVEAARAASTAASTTATTTHAVTAVTGRCTSSTFHSSGGISRRTDAVATSSAAAATSCTVSASHTTTATACEDGSTSRTA